MSERSGPGTVEGFRRGRDRISAGMAGAAWCSAFRHVRWGVPGGGGGATARTGGAATVWDGAMGSSGGFGLGKQVVGSGAGEPPCDLIGFADPGEDRKAQDRPGRTARESGR